MTFKTQKKGDIGKADEDRTTITVSWATKRELKTFGMMGESEEDVIKRLMFKKKTGQENDKTKLQKRIEDAL